MAVRYAWLRRFFGHHLPRDPSTLDHEAVDEFLSALAIKGRVSASTQNQARSALAFYFRHVRRMPLPALEGVTPASRPRRLSVVLSRDEVLAVLRQLSGAKQLVAMLLYGSGLRLLEALRSSFEEGRATRIVRPSSLAHCMRTFARTWSG